MKKIKNWLVPSAIILIYLLTHLYQLTLLPVFADESIYIRWTQLIIDDWQQYLFFPMNDGKTPLMMWLMIPWQFVFSNQLFAGRFAAVLIGLGQVISLGYLTKILGGKNRTSWIAMILGSILPFWFFHHRMALTDGLLALGITWSMIGTVQIIKDRQKSKWILLTALFVGLSLWSKLPALLAIPSLFLYAWLEPGKINKKLSLLIKIGLAVLGGLLIFLSLRLHPVFPQLFSRGSDFLYPWQEVFLQGKWQDTVINIPTYLKYFVSYLTLPVLIFNLMGQFLPDKKQRRIQHILLLSLILFAGPIAILGKVVYPRYLFPIVIFSTVSAALSVQELLLNKKRSELLKGLVGGLLIYTVVISSRFIYYSVTNPAQTPFVSADQEQYLYKWSSGHGVVESVELIKKEAKDKRVSVATEGSFGTLPDGVLMYFHRRNVDNIYVEGIGYPVKGIPEKFANRAKSFDQVLLIVNSHRLEIELSEENLLQEYCRPDHAPCLQVWDITQLVKNN